MSLQNKIICALLVLCEEISWSSSSSSSDKRKFASDVQL